MKITDIPLDGWERERLFRSYLGADFPYIVISARVDVTALLSYCRREGLSFYFALAYECARTADAIPNFRYRFEGERVYELAYNRVVLTHIRPGESKFIMIEGPHTEDLREFCEVLHQRAALATPGERLDAAAGENTLISFSCLPWIDYTHFTRSIMRAGQDCNPKISWGKYVTEQGRERLTLSLQTHHGLMDGLHAGLFYENLQGALDAYETNATK